MDQNGNSLLSLAEVTSGIRNYFRPSSLSIDKKVIDLAFSHAKQLSAGKDDNLIDYGEFGALLKLTAQYHAYAKVFDSADVQSDDKISYEEFLKAEKKLRKFGVDMSEPERAWS